MTARSHTRSRKKDQRRALAARRRYDARRGITRKPKPKRRWSDLLQPVKGTPR